MEETLNKVLCSLQAACARREYCSSDILAKAMRLTGGDARASQEILSSLESDGFVDDARYAAAFAREKSSITGWGPHKIATALKMKGIGRDLIESALSETDGQKSAQRLRKLLENKWKSLRGDPYAKFKLLRYALGRGYGYDEAGPLVDRIVREADADFSGEGPDGI